VDGLGCAPHLLPRRVGDNTSPPSTVMQRGEKEVIFDAPHLMHFLLELNYEVQYLTQAFLPLPPAIAIAIGVSLTHLATTSSQTTVIDSCVYHARITVSMPTKNCFVRCHLQIFRS
jgi:hypothetical protein